MFAVTVMPMDVLRVTRGGRIYIANTLQKLSYFWSVTKGFVRDNSFSCTISLSETRERLSVKRPLKA